MKARGVAREFQWLIPIGGRIQVPCVPDASAAALGIDTVRATWMSYSRRTMALRSRKARGQLFFLQMEMQKGILSLFHCFLFYSFVCFSRFDLRDFVALFVLV